MSDKPVPRCLHCGRETLPCCDACRVRLRASSDALSEALGLDTEIDRLRAEVASLRAQIRDRDAAAVAHGF